MGAIQKRGVPLASIEGFNVRGNRYGKAEFITHDQCGVKVPAQEFAVIADTTSETNAPLVVHVAGTCTGCGESFMKQYILRSPPSQHKTPWYDIVALERKMESQAFDETAIGRVQPFSTRLEQRVGYYRKNPIALLISLIIMALCVTLLMGTTPLSAIPAFVLLETFLLWLTGSSPVSIVPRDGQFIVPVKG